MAYQNAHVKVTLYGDCFGGAEEWSTGFRMGQEGDASGNFAINEAWVQTVKTEWATFFQLPANGFGVDWRITGVKAAIVLPDGKTDLGNVINNPYGTPGTGAYTIGKMPPQVSLVAQLRSASPVGLASKGRMYLPGVSVAPDATGHVPTATANSIATTLRTFFDNIETAAGSPGYVINASKGRPGVPFTAPINKRVTMVRVGNVYDTQRRRRNGLTEIYSSATLVA